MSQVKPPPFPIYGCVTRIAATLSGGGIWIRGTTGGGNDGEWGFRIHRTEQVIEPVITYAMESAARVQLIYHGPGVALFIRVDTGSSNEGHEESETVEDMGNEELMPPPVFTTEPASVTSVALNLEEAVLYIRLSTAPNLPRKVPTVEMKHLVMLAVRNGWPVAVNTKEDQSTVTGVQVVARRGGS